MKRIFEKDFAKLRGRIREMFGTEVAFAREMKISTTTLSHKLSGKKQFKAKEIFKAKYLLNIDKADIWDYFFNYIV